MRAIVMTGAKVQVMRTPDIHTCVEGDDPLHLKVGASIMTYTQALLCRVVS